jgi:hypothetical protein
MQGTATGSTPTISSSNTYAIAANLCKTIQVRMKNSSTATTAKFYFITTTDTTYNEAKSITFPITPNDPNYSLYTIDLSSLSTWAGIVTQLRFDPGMGSPGYGITFSIQSIKVTTGSSGALWTFDTGDSQGWTINNNVSGLAVSNGRLQGTATGAYPEVISADGYDIDGSTYKTIKVCMKNASPATAAKFHYITNADGTWDEIKEVTFPIIPNDTNFTVYTVNMSSAPGWTGNMRRLRFSPLEVGGNSGMTFSIDYLQITQ